MHTASICAPLQSPEEMRGLYQGREDLPEDVMQKRETLMQAINCALLALAKWRSTSSLSLHGMR